MSLLMFNLYSDSNSIFKAFILYDIDCFKIIFYLTLEFACSSLVTGREYIASHFMGSVVNLSNRSTLNLLKEFYVCSAM